MMKTFQTTFLSLLITSSIVSARPAGRPRQNTEFVNIAASVANSSYCMTQNGIGANITLDTCAGSSEQIWVIGDANTSSQVIANSISGCWQAIINEQVTPSVELKTCNETAAGQWWTFFSSNNTVFKLSDADLCINNTVGVGNAVQLVGCGNITDPDPTLLWTIEQLV